MTGFRDTDCGVSLFHVTHNDNVLDTDIWFKHDQLQRLACLPGNSLVAATVGVVGIVS